MKTIVYIALATALTHGSVSAAEGNPVAAGATSGASDPVTSWTKTPTRYLGKAENDYIQAMKARLAVSGQVVGPFGRQQDPNKEPDKIVFKRRGPVRKNRNTPFADVVNSIKITTVNMAEKSFFVSSRKFRVGQKFPIVVGKEKFDVRVDGIKSTAITFTEMKSGERVVHQLDILPAGMSSGGSVIPVDGLFSTGGGRAAPLEVNLRTPDHSN